MDYGGLLEVESYCDPSPQKIRTHIKEIVMAKVIEFYVPTNFRTPLKGAPRRCAKVIEFCTQTNKSA
jgi:hypothetical protein